MRLIGIMYLLSFCEYLAAPVDVTREPSMLMKNIIWTSKNLSNDAEFNSDVILNTPEMIRRAGYPAEAHVVATEDGYLLTLHRIPGGNDSPPVLIQHGILCSSADWVVLGKGKALAYLLADQGYDVWLGNFRGNTYSKAHISLSPSELRFWNFSFHEMGIYDLPAMITFIANMRSQPLHTYIGYSMGTTAFYIMALKHPKIAQMVQLMISLSSVAFTNHMKSPVKYLIPFWRDFKMMIRFVFHDEIQSDFVRILLKYGCNQNITGDICSNVLFMFTGYDQEQYNYVLEPIIFGNFPASTSVKAVTHYFQGVQTGKFRQYDYGCAKNLLIYNSTEPPDYDLTNVTVPIALFYSDNDLFTSTKDVKKLYHLLPNIVDMYEVPWPNFNHIDYMWAKDAPKFVYERILEIMKGRNLNNVTSMR